VGVGFTFPPLLRKHADLCLAMSDVESRRIASRGNRATAMRFSVISKEGEHSILGKHLISNGLRGKETMLVGVLAISFRIGVGHRLETECESLSAGN
jgi:hypothetical protein